ncbi:TVP38/TMEM64 family protein [Anaerostipes caccae]|uniref:TVP38/TMEM64 family protein n=1 Tax=Anaerostipes caccae TaxID=105841 RepID=UPI00101C01AB|nr:TVP38/TMEM64 family protein [Anaerostipes caccae]
MSRQAVKKATNFTTLVLIGALIIFSVYGYQKGIFTSRDQLELFIRQSSFWGPLLFIVIQIAQVVIAVIPGGLTCLAGVVFFGPWYGFLYSAVGIIIGSCINFYLARRYGEKFIRLFVSDETYEKTKKKFLTGKKFDVVFTAAILLPCAPDDVLCMLAGLTDMSWRKFLTILFLGRPVTIVVYSLGGAMLPLLLR